MAVVKVVSKLVCMVLLVSFCTPFSVAENNRWSYSGPNGASISTFTFHPTIKGLVFAGGNGLFRSRNGGKTWQHLSSPSTAIRIHPLNPNVILAFSSQSFFSSSDEGNTWQQISNLLLEPYQNIADVEFHPTQSLVVYAFVRHGPLLISSDGGITWSRLTGIVGSAAFGFLEVSPANGDVLYVALSNGQRIFKSTDGGKSFKAFGKGLEDVLSSYDLEIDPSNQNTLYLSSQNHVYKSIDSGKTWKLTTAPCRYGKITVDPNESKRIFCSGNGVFESRDAAESWTEIRIIPESGLEFPFRRIAIDPFNSEVLVIGTTDSVVLRTENSGSTWKRATHGLDVLALNPLTASGTPPSIFALSQAGTLHISLNGGRNWLRRIGLQGLIGLSSIAVHSKNSDLIVIGYSNLGDDLYLSKDGGKTWFKRKTPIDPSFLSFDAISQNVLYAGNLGSSGTIEIQRSDDLGKTWVSILQGLQAQRPTRLTVDPMKGSHLFIGTSSGKIFQSPNGGRTWEKSSGGLKANFEILAITRDPADPNIVYAGATGGKVYKSTNGGRNWIEIIVVEDAAHCCNEIFIDHSNSEIVHVAGYGVLYTSLDAGKTWKSADTTGLSDGFDSFSFFSFLPPSTLLFSTSSGLYSYTLN